MIHYKKYSMMTLDYGVEITQFRENDQHADSISLYLIIGERDVAPCKSVRSWCNGL